jgi:cytochrome P450
VTETDDQVKSWQRDHINDFDLNSTEFNADYQDVMERLPKECPVARSTVGTGYGIITRYHDVRKAAQDWRTFSSAKGHVPNRPEGMPWLYPEESDPPYHNVWRRVLNRHFGPEALEVHVPQIKAYTNQLLDGFLSRGSCDFATEFADLLPAMVFGKCLLGLSEEKVPQLQDAVYRALNGPVEGRPQGWIDAAMIMNERLLERAEQPPEDDFLGAVLTGVDTDEGEPCPWEDKLSVLTLVMAGGVGTTAYVLSCVVSYLAQRPDIRQRLIDEPELRPQAIEEFIRYYPAIGLTGREVRQEVEVAGVTFKPGDYVCLALGAASFDPEVFDDPDEIDIDRQNIRQSAFGFGVHRCLGSTLARQELSIALDILLERLPEPRLRDGFQPEFESGISRHFMNLELVWEPKP